MQFAEPARARAFDCTKCPESVQRLRRCHEDKEFTSADGNIWPMRVSDGGTLFGFCPGKAQRDNEAYMMYKALLISVETGSLYEHGGIVDQPAWWVELASWFLPRYNDLRFYARAKAILGDGKEVKNGSHKKLSRVPNKSNHG